MLFLMLILQHHSLLSSNWLYCLTGFICSLFIIWLILNAFTLNQYKTFGKSWKSTCFIIYISQKNRWHYQRWNVGSSELYHIDKIFKQHLTKDAGKNVNCRILIYLKTFERFEKSVIGINFYWLAKTNQKVSGNLSLFQNVLSSLIVKLLSATLLPFVLN